MTWKDSNYAYRQSIAVNGSTDGLQTNYQLQLTVYKGTGTSSGSSVYLNGNCKDDFSDIRFYNSSGALLDYWIESYTSGTSAVVWVEVDSIPASPLTATIWIYYDYVSAVSSSDGTATFIFFDDFSGDLSKWDYIPSGWVISSGRLEANSSDTAKALLPDNYTNLLVEAIINDSVTTNVRRVKVTDGGSNYNSAWVSWSSQEVQLIKTGEVLAGTVAYTLNANTNYIAGIAKVGSNWYLYMDRVLEQTENSWLSETTYDIELSCESTDTTYWDNVIARNYTTNPPTLSANNDPTPQVTTSSATKVTTTSATLNGENVATVPIRGFVWDTSSHSNPGNVAPASSGYSDYNINSGSFVAGNYFYSMSSGIGMYYFRAVVQTESGIWEYGGELSFLITIFTTPKSTTYYSSAYYPQHGGEGVAWPGFRRSFKANSLYWAFYADDVNIYFVTSKDNVTWSAATILKVLPANLSSASEEGYDIYFDGTYCHYALSVNLGSPDYNSTVYYRRFKPNSDGTITFSTIEQNFTTAVDAQINLVSLYVDQDGYPVIATSFSNVPSYGNYEPFICRSSTNDGTWSMAAGYPLALTPAFTNQSYQPESIVKLSNNKFYVLYTGIFSSYGTLSGYLYNGADFSAMEVLNLPNTYLQGHPSTITDADDNIYLVHPVNLYLNSGNDSLYFAIRSYAGGWNTPVTLYDSASTTEPIQCLIMNTGLGYLLLFVVINNLSTTTIYYKRYFINTSSWDTNWTPFLIDSSGIMQSQYLNGFYGSLSLQYTQNSTYNLIFVTASVIITPGILHSYLRHGICTVLGNSQVTHGYATP